MESKIDYLTLSLKPGDDKADLGKAFIMLRKALLLDDLINKADFKRGVGFYDYRRSYENIQILYTVPERFSGQGLCIKMSSLGLDYFNRYLQSYGMTLKEWLGMWRGMVFGGMWVTKVTRFDYAMDDIRFNGETPFVTLEKVFKCAERGEICKKARTVDILEGSEISKRTRIKYSEGKPIKGRTLYIGVRKSGNIVRFYDKLAERIHRKEPLPVGCTTWTRCEIEFHKEDAMSAANAFLDYSDKDFAEHMRGVINNQCRFIVRNNANVSRCTSKRWWRDFLGGCTKNFKLPHKSPYRSAYSKSERYLKQTVRTVYTVYQEIGLEGIFRFFEDEVNELKKNNKDPYIPELGNNIREGLRDYEEMTGLKHYTYNSSDELIVMDGMKRQLSAYFSRLHKIEQSADIKERHERFMDYGVFGLGM